jgi:hypothetical protein
MEASFYKDNDLASNMWAGKITGQYNALPSAGDELLIVDGTGTQCTISSTINWQNGVWHGQIMDGEFPAFGTFDGNAGGSYDEGTQTFIGIAAGIWDDTT